jgi:hypothetical protein
MRPATNEKPTAKHGFAAVDFRLQNRSATTRTNHRILVPGRIV